LYTRALTLAVVHPVESRFTDGDTLLSKRILDEKQTYEDIEGKHSRK